MSEMSIPNGSGQGIGDGSASTPDPRRWLILGVVGLAQLMVILDATIVNIALPSAQRALHFSTGDRQWVVTAYALAFSALLPLPPAALSPQQLNLPRENTGGRPKMSRNVFEPTSSSPAVPACR